MAKHHFRKAHKTPTRQAAPHGSQITDAPSGDGTPFIPPQAGGEQPQTPMAGPSAAPPMSAGARMKGRYGAAPPDDAGM